MLEKNLSARPNSERLSERRRRSRRRGIVFFTLLLLLLFAASIYGLQQNAVRISHIQVFDDNSEIIKIADIAVQGNYFGIIPRDSIFFFPEKQIRSSILKTHPEIAAVSIYRDSFSSIYIKIDNRVPIARWCGLAPTAYVDKYCYVFDAHGFIFATVASSTKTINDFTLYSPLVSLSDEEETLEPLRATIANSEKLPDAFDFARHLEQFGSRVSEIVLINDEVNCYLINGTRITYVLGDEEKAFTALTSAKENFNLADGSVEYIDIRFDGKVYLKRKSDTVSE